MTVWKVAQKLFGTDLAGRSLVAWVYDISVEKHPMSRLLKTADGYYYPVPKKAVERGLFGPYLDYVGPWPSEEVARLMEQRLNEACEQAPPTRVIVYRYIGSRTNL
jgi:hypothetical protein